MTNRLRNNVPIIIANWKMHGLLLETMQLFKDLRSRIHKNLVSCEIVICPPFTLLRDMAEKVPGTGVKLGGQDCHWDKEGSYTGEISAIMLEDMTCEFVIVGHSERRINHHETSQIIAKKAEAAHASSLISIICIGENREQRESGNTKDIIKNQMLESIPRSANSQNTIIAYEPIWAIGAKSPASVEQIQEIHQYIKEVAKKDIKQFESDIKIVYGGSVTEENSLTILNTPGVDGLLVGRASLDANKFWQIIEDAGKVKIGV